ncbi:hypothetical protein Lfu02_79990 [Longispora fulva]|uniref:Uncharacterized protein n=1 Tax=Longispora fulva TaxID=619741 RepID=A0A8J7H486_9ACTN|nr:XF1762 family protein [Longispora fulva]MBG6141118.1 hypothetical protein [Longispora fulva]GIG63627.1 hypothetical protein Lfu02_79990 [Longispora fulva]
MSHAHEAAIPLHVVPLDLAAANRMVATLHRHHPKVASHRYSIGVIDDQGVIRGAAILSRPAARMTDWHTVVEVSRLVTDGTPNACSMLYGAAARAAKALGFRRVQTFILDTEPGTTLRAAGWVLDGVSPGGSWASPSRPARDLHPTGPKQRWVKDVNPVRPRRADLDG